MKLLINPAYIARLNQGLLPLSLDKKRINNSSKTVKINATELMSKLAQLKQGLRCFCPLLFITEQLILSKGEA